MNIYLSNMEIFLILVLIFLPIIIEYLGKKSKTLLKYRRVLEDFNKVSHVLAVFLVYRVIYKIFM